MNSNSTSRLDENIIALSMLGSRRSAQKAQSSIRRSLSETENKWCCVLDELSWLCDYRTGGKTVTSIAAQATVAGTVFWFANNKTVQPSIEQHLRWILRELRSFANSPEKNVREIQQKLFAKAIVFNRRRVEFYYEKLDSLWQDVKSEPDRKLDPSLTGYMDRLVTLRNNHEELCFLAFRWRNNPLEVQLKQCIQDSMMEPIWGTIRHYIGRLGSWWSACTVLISAAKVDAGMFLNCRLKPVPSEPTMDTMLLHQDSTRVLPHSASSEQETERLARRLSGTRVHAELLVLNHFYRQNLAFAGSVSYIGCSKLSCYCCHIYMKLHPRAVLPRPCHGNTWVRWAMPILQMDHHGESSSQDARLLAGMISQMQQEIEIDSVTVDRQLESTTGISENCKIWQT